MKAVAYCRTSSASNVGPDRDSERRQLDAIHAYAKASGIEIVGAYYDAAVSGTDQIHTRPGFSSMLEMIEGSGIHTIIVETSSRFARDLLVQEVGYALLQERGIQLTAADSPSSFLDDGPTSRLIRQVLGAVAEFEKSMTVLKLKGSRDRKRRATGCKVEGRKSVAERFDGIALVAEAHRLRRRSGKTGRRRSLRMIAEELASLGATSSKGTPFSASVVKRLLES